MTSNPYGLYRQIGFQNQDDWKGETYRHLMQDRIPFVRIAHDPFIRNGTLRVTSHTSMNLIGRLNLDGLECPNGRGISIYNQEEEIWRDGRVGSDDKRWYFTSRDGGSDMPLR